VSIRLSIFSLFLSIRPLTHLFIGNAWAAAGITRVLATIQHSSFSGNFKSEMNDLAGWAREIMGGMYGVVVSVIFV
jgi:hypothetical protein